MPKGSVKKNGCKVQKHCMNGNKDETTEKKENIDSLCKEFRERLRKKQAADKLLNQSFCDCESEEEIEDDCVQAQNFSSKRCNKKCRSKKDLRKMAGLIDEDDECDVTFNGSSKRSSKKCKDTKNRGNYQNNVCEQAFKKKKIKCEDIDDCEEEESGDDCEEEESGDDCEESVNYSSKRCNKKCKDTKNRRNYENDLCEQAFKKKNKNKKCDMENRDDCEEALNELCKRSNKRRKDIEDIDECEEALNGSSKRCKTKCNDMEALNELCKKFKKSYKNIGNIDECEDEDEDEEDINGSSKKCNKKCKDKENRQKSSVSNNDRSKKGVCSCRAKDEEDDDNDSSEEIDLVEFLRRRQAKEQKKLRLQHYPSTKNNKDPCEEQYSDDDDDDSNDVFTFLGKNDDCKGLLSNLETAKNAEKPEVSTDVILKLESGYRKMMHSFSQSLLKQHLTQKIFDKLKLKKTQCYESNLLDCVRSGFENCDSVVGIYAAEEESYTVFKQIFDPIIESYHWFGPCVRHPSVYYGNPGDFGAIDPKGKYVISVRIQCSRSLRCFPFAPYLSKAQYKEMEEMVKNNLLTLDGDFKGNYYSLGALTDQEKQKLLCCGILPQKGGRFLKSAKAVCYWPIGRGIYLNSKKNFVVWVNESDHLCIISKQKGSDIGAAYQRLIDGLKKLKGLFLFVKDRRLGFLTFSPTNLGTAMKASAIIKLEQLADQEDKLVELTEKCNLNVENYGSTFGYYEVSNKHTLGLTEYEVIQELFNGVCKLIKAEKRLIKLENCRKVLCPSGSNKN